MTQRKPERAFIDMAQLCRCNGTNNALLGFEHGIVLHLVSPLDRPTRQASCRQASWAQNNLSLSVNVNPRSDCHTTPRAHFELCIADVVAGVGHGGILFSCAAPGIRGNTLVMMAKKEDDDDPSKSGSAKRVAVRGHKTDVRLEDALWKELRAMAEERDVTLSELLNSIDIKRKRSKLSEAIRLFVSSYRRKRR